MNKSILKIIIYAISSVFFVLPAFSQNPVLPDTLNSKYPISLFLQANTKPSRLNNGREYISNAPYIKGHPFFASENWTTGNLVYDGVYFKDIKMRYDLAKDEIIVLNFALPNKLSLVKQKVMQFDILDHHFIFLKLDSLNKENREGFYDQLYHHKLSVLARRKKEIVVTSNTSLDANFVQADKYYLVRNGVMFPVKSQSSVMKLLKDKKAGIQQYMRKNGIVFREDPEQAMVKMVAYYDQMSN